MTRQIFAAEISYDEIPLSARAQFSSEEKEVRKYLSDFRQIVEEVYIVATDTRFAVYIVHESITPLTTFFHEQHNLRGYVQLYYNTGESVSHLIAMASGLLSTIKGDTGVLHAVSRSYQWAREMSALGLILDHTVSKAIETGARIRTVTAIDQFSTSLVDTGIELLFSRVDNLLEKKVIVVGSSTLARVALETLVGEWFVHVAITGRDGDRVKQLAKAHKVKSFGIRLLPEYFANSDIIIAAEYGELSPQVEEIRKGAPARDDRVILDFGVPPTLDENKLEDYCAEYYNVDDLRRLQPSPLEALGGIEEAWRRAVKASNEFSHLLQLLNHAPILTAYLARQFYQRGGSESKTRYRRSLRDLLFRRSPKDEEIALQKVTVAQHANNCLADDGHDVVRHVRGFSKFRYYLPDN